MNNRRNLIFLFFLAVLVFAIRFPFLTEKPIHHDESVFGWFIIQMWRQGFYRYDPTNYHGPFFFYLVQLSELFFGRGLWSVRALPALFSGLLVLFFFWLGFHEKKIWWLGALVLLLSPAAEFFGRSGIQESLLVLSLIVCLEQLRNLFLKFDERRVLYFFISLALAFSLKETAAIFVLSLLLAIPFFAKGRIEQWRQVLRQNKIALGKAALISFTLIVLIFSGFFQHMHGVVDFFAAYLPWLKTGTQGNGHEKPFYYWSRLLAKNEWATLLLAISPFFFWKKISLSTRYFVAVGWVQFLLYSLIPYKTPWCLITMQGPFVYAGILTLGEQKRKIQQYVGAAVGIATLAMVPLFYQLSLRRPILTEHDYVYVQGSYEYKAVESFFYLNRDLIGNRTLAVAFSDYWPLPYTFVDFNLRYMTQAEPIPKNLDVLFYDAIVKERVHTELGDDFVSREFMVRNSRAPGVVFVRKSLFEQMKGSWQ